MKSCLMELTIESMCVAAGYKRRKGNIISKAKTLSFLLYAGWSSWQLARLISDCGSIQKYLDELGVNSKEAKDVKKGRKKNYWI